MILNKSPGLLWGAGGAMMAWELAQRRVFGSFGTIGKRPDKCRCEACREFYRIIDRASLRWKTRDYPGGSLVRL